MKKLILAAAALLMVPHAAWAQDAPVVDYLFLAECAASYSVKAEESAGKIPAEYTDIYFQAASSFHEKAVSGGGEEMNQVYKNKVAELRGVAANDTLGKQSKRALEKQCTAAATENGIRIK